MKTQDLFYSAKSYSPFTNLSILFLRIYVGFTMMSVGLDKLPLPSWMVDQVVELGFPFATAFAWIACFSEFAFGILLILGLMTRISAFFIAFVMGVAAFAFHQVIPLFDMHIAHHYVWSGLILMSCGGGKWSVDYAIITQYIKGKKKYSFIGPIVFSLLIALATFIELTGEVNPGDNANVEITSINIPGSFNNWDPSVNEMTTADEQLYVLDLEFEKSGLIEFKFTANKSWDINFGDAEKESGGIPLYGVVELEADNISVYLPQPGMYRFTVNRENFEYSVELL